MRLATRLYEMSNYSCGLQILNYRVVPMIIRIVFDSPERYNTRESVITDYSYGMWSVDCLRYVTQWVGILIIYTRVCMLYVHWCVNTYNKVHSVALGLDLVS